MEEAIILGAKRAIKMLTESGQTGGGGFETVTISTSVPISGEEVSLSAEDSALLETATQKDMPFIIEYASSSPDGEIIMYSKAVASLTKNSAKEISCVATVDLNGTTVFGCNDASAWFASRVVDA